MNGSSTRELLTVIKNLTGWRGVETPNEWLDGEEIQTEDKG